MRMLSVVAYCIKPIVVGLPYGSLVVIFLRNYYYRVNTIYISGLDDRIEGTGSIIVKDDGLCRYSMSYERVKHSFRFIVTMLTIDVVGIITTACNNLLDFARMIQLNSAFYAVVEIVVMGTLRCNR